MAEKYLYIKIPYQDTDALYTDLLQEKLENKELTLFIKRLLDAYHKDESIREAIDTYINENSATNVIMSRITNILEEQNRLTVLLDMIQNEVNLGVQTVSNNISNDVDINKGSDNVVEIKALPEQDIQVDQVKEVNVIQAKSEYEHRVNQNVDLGDLADFGLEIVADEEPLTETEKEFAQLFSSMQRG